MIVSILHLSLHHKDLHTFAHPCFCNIDFVCIHLLRISIPTFRLPVNAAWIFISSLSQRLFCCQFLIVLIPSFYAINMITDVQCSLSVSGSCFRLNNGRIILMEGTSAIPSELVGSNVSIWLTRTWSARRQTACY